MDWKLKIVYDPDNDEIVIMGNKKGFEFLIECCKEVIEKDELKTGHYHCHLQWQMNNLLEGSTETVLVISDDLGDYQKIGKE